MTILAPGNTALLIKGQLNATTLTAEHRLGDRGGLRVFDNLWLTMKISALNSTEKLDMYGEFAGIVGYRTAVLATQIDLKANDSDTITQDLSGLGPIIRIKLVATLLAGVETVDYSISYW